MTTDAAQVARSSVRVTLVGDRGPVDLVVPRWMTASGLVAEYASQDASQGGASTAGSLVTPAGQALPSDAELQDLGVENGDVLVVTAAPPPYPTSLDEPTAPAATSHVGRPVVQVTGSAVAGGAGGRRSLAGPDSSPAGVSAPPARSRDRSHDPRGHLEDPSPAGMGPGSEPGLRTRATLLGLGALCAAGSAVVAATQGSGMVRVWCAALLGTAALVTALPLPATRVDGRLRAAGSAAFAAAAGFAAAYSEATGGLLLGLAVAALCATGAAAVSRAWLDPEDDDLADVALVVGATASVIGVVMLMLGSSVLSFLALAYGAAVVAARLLPYLVVDVPDEALLDLDRLQNTAWSAREAPRRGKRTRVIVRAEGVATVVRRSQRLLTAGTLVISGVIAVGGVLLVQDARPDVEGVSRVAMVLLGAGALALVARSVRARVPRLALRLSAALVTGWTGVLLIGDGDARTTWWVFAVAAALGALTVTVALALGQGWRSVWWGRVADLAEALSVVLVVAAVPLATGAFTAVRSLVS